MTLKEMKDLYDFDAWAMNRTLETVETIPEEQFIKELGSSHGGIRGTLVHTFSADTIWFKRWKGESPTKAISPEELPTFQMLKSKWEQHQKEISAFVRSLDDKKLLEPFGYKDFKGNNHSQLLYQQLQHKVNHSSYHRGQVITMLRQLGVKPQSTDLIQFYRLEQNNG